MMNEASEYRSKLIDIVNAMINNIKWLTIVMIIFWMNSLKNTLKNERVILIGENTQKLSSTLCN